MQIYRYRPDSQYLLTELSKDELWFSRFADLNDPFEDAYINKSGRGDIDYLIRRFTVCCFSLNNDDPLLWAHYADGHRGVCLEFEISDKEYRGTCLQVNYSDQRPILRVIRTTDDDDLHLDIDNEARIFLTKSPDWSYEQEVRVVRIEDDAEGSGRLHRPPAKLTGVDFGLRASDSFASRVKKLMLDRSGASFKQATYAETGY